MRHVRFKARLLFIHLFFVGSGEARSESDMEDVIAGWEEGLSNYDSVGAGDECDIIVVGRVFVLEISKDGSESWAAD